MTSFVTVRKTVKLWNLSPVATLEVYKCDNGMKTDRYKYKKNTIEVILECFLTTRTAATTPRTSIFTLSLLKIRAFFKQSPMFAALFLKDEKRYRQTIFTIVNYIYKKI